MVFLSTLLFAQLFLVPVEFAGTYYSGDGVGANAILTIEIDGSYSLRTRGCITDESSESGLVWLEGSDIRFVPSPSNVGERVVAISWGQRRYLVPNARLIRFCNDINLGIQPTKSSGAPYFIGNSNWLWSVRGKPSVPKEWESYLLERPVNGYITSAVGDSKFSVSFGKSSGIKVGMVLHTSVLPGFLQVVSVSDDVCIVESDFGEWLPIELEVGDRVDSQIR